MSVTSEYYNEFQCSDNKDNGGKALIRDLWSGEVKFMLNDFVFANENTR